MPRWTLPFADQSVGDIPEVLKPAVDSKDEKSENERSETVDEGDITEEKCWRYFKFRGEIPDFIDLMK